MRVKRHVIMPVSVAWLVVVVAAFVVTTALLAALIRTTDGTATAAHVIGQATVSATFACLVVGGPATAVALRTRRCQSMRRAALSGLATAVLVLLFLGSYVAATGTPVPWTWQALVPLVIVTAAQLSLALRLRRHCRDDSPSEQTRPEQTRPEQTRPEQAPPDHTPPEATALPVLRTAGLAGGSSRSAAAQLASGSIPDGTARRRRRRRDAGPPSAVPLTARSRRGQQAD
jgi:hypothetical protein